MIDIESQSMESFEFELGKSIEDLKEITTKKLHQMVQSLTQEIDQRVQVI